MSPETRFRSSASFDVRLMERLTESSFHNQDGAHKTIPITTVVAGNCQSDLSPAKNKIAMNVKMQNVAPDNITK
jgi:hypothetical protein